MNVQDIKVISTSKKGAAQIECAGKTVWIRPSAMKALAAGRVLPQVKKAIENADATAAAAKNMRPFRKIKPAQYFSISEKAVVIKCHNGAEAVVPKSQIIEGISDLLVADWVIKSKNLQAANQIVWMEA